MKTYVTSFGVLLALSAAALAQSGFPQGPPDFNSLRSQVMSRHFGPAATDDLRVDSAPSLMSGKLNLDERIWSEWGVDVAPVPALLTMHCPKLKQDAGLLIDAIRPGSPAEQAGLIAGQVLAGAEDKWFLSAEDLPSLSEPRIVIVLVAGELREVKIQPSTAPLLANQPQAKLRSARSAATFSAAADGGESQAISLACVNGVFDIEASYATAKGQEKVHLTGSRKQIEKSMADLPDSLRQAIKRRLQMVSPAGAVY